MPFHFSIAAVESLSGTLLETHMHQLGLPEESLGLLHAVIQRMVYIQQTNRVELRKLHHLIFCADHGIYHSSHRSNISPLTTTDSVQRLLNGQTPVALLCQQHQVELSVIDCGLADLELDPQPQLIRRRIAAGTRDFRTVAAMTEEEFNQAVAIGSELAALNMAEGARILSFGALGLGSTTSAAAITMAILLLPADHAVTNQNHVDPQVKHNKVAALTQALTLHRSDLSDGWSVARILGGFEIAAIMGAMAMTAELGGLFLVDGFACSAALLALSRVYPNVIDYALFTHQSSHLAQHSIMAHFEQRPLLSLDLALGEGTGSVLAWPLLASAVYLLRNGPVD